MSKVHSVSCQQLVEYTGGLMAEGFELNKDYFSGFFKNKFAYTRLAHYFLPEGVGTDEVNTEKH